jgi:hypothetical protein
MFYNVLGGQEGLKCISNTYIILIMNQVITFMETYEIIAKDHQLVCEMPFIVLFDNN